MLHAVYSSLADARCDIKQLLTPVRRGPPLAHEPGCYTAVSRSRPGPWRSDNWEPVRSGRGAGVSSLAPELPSLPRMQTSGSSALPEMQCRTGPRAARRERRQSDRAARGAPSVEAVVRERHTVRALKGGRHHDFPSFPLWGLRRVAAFPADCLCPVGLARRAKRHGSGMPEDIRYRMTACCQALRARSCGPPFG